MNNIIDIKNLTYTYSPGTPFEWCAVNDVSLTVKEGDFIGIIGHTGSGKSTLISHFNGLLKPTSGSVTIDGEDIWKVKNRKMIRFKVGLVFQYPEYQLFEETVYKDIAFGPKNMGLAEGEIKDRITSAIKFVGLPDEILEKSPFELSGGQKRRVAIAGVIAMRPKVLVLDEPTASLDPAGKKEILNHIRDYHKTEKSTVILISHSMDDIAKAANSILVMKKSKVHLYDTVENIFKNTNSLDKIGLDLPMMTCVFSQLKEKGYPVSDGVFTVEGALKELVRLKGGNINA